MAYPIWHDELKNKVTCVEKIKVLEEGLDELIIMVSDILADAVLMGIEENQIREYLVSTMLGVKPRL